MYFCSFICTCMHTNVRDTHTHMVTYTVTKKVMFVSHLREHMILRILNTRRIIFL